MTNHDQDTILFYAFRYALGRMTYSVFDVVDIIIKNVDIVSINHRQLMIKEIKNAIENGRAGMQMDVEEWKRLVRVLDNIKISSPNNEENIISSYPNKKPIC